MNLLITVTLKISCKKSTTSLGGEEWTCVSTFLLNMAVRDLVQQFRPILSGTWDL